MKFRVRKSLRENESGYITLYHNTPYKNVKSILENGLKIASSKSEKASGYQMTWATDHPLMKDDSYGGNVVKFRLPKDYRYDKVNDDQYIIYDDIEPELIDSVDYMIGRSGSGYMHQSQLPQFIDRFGKDKVKSVLTRYHNDELSLDELKELTPELDWE